MAKQKDAEVTTAQKVADAKSVQAKKEKRLTERGFVQIVAKKGAPHMKPGKIYWEGQEMAEHLVEKGYAEMK